MDLSLLAIAEHLQPYDVKINISPQFTEKKYKYATLYDREIALQNDCIYIIESNKLSMALHAFKPALIIVGEPADDSVLTHCPSPCLIVPQEKTMALVLSEVQQCFEKFRNWYGEACNIILNGGDLQQLCTASASLLENPMFIHDSNFMLLAHSNDQPEKLGWIYDKHMGVYVLSEEIFNGFMVEQAFLDTMHQTSAAYYDGLYPLATLYINLSDTTTFRGRLVVAAEKRPFTHSDFLIVEELGKLIRQTFRFQLTAPEHYLRNFEAFMRETIEGRMVDECNIQSYLNYKKWAVNDPFLCLKLKPENQDSRVSTAIYTCRLLERTLEDAFAFLYEENIVCIVRTKSLNINHIVSQLHYILRDGLFKAGISQPYFNLIDTSLFYRQASIALEYGLNHHPTIWCHRFSDHAVPYLLEKGLAKNPTSLFCHPGVLALQEFSQATKVDYYTTLKAYLRHNMNILKTAEALYIHRSTLFYRLNRINNVINVDLDDPDVRFYILLSYALLEHANAQPSFLL